ncbi:MAG: RdgB/HAM1 family non-canonical purine NTP pyrophosphatase [Pseudomonadota bacterium]
MYFPAGTELVIASHNQGKIKEIRDLLSHLSLKISCAADYDLDDPEETERTFEGNALLKARYVAERTGKASLSDDSGLSVNALNGAPGIYSARWAGPDRDFAMAMERVKTEITQQAEGDIPDMSASFFCAIALVDPRKNEEKTFLGEVKGQLTFPPRGEKGFGYDPIFIANGMDQTFGEIDPDYKHSISHRADAMRQLFHSLSG